MEWLGKTGGRIVGASFIIAMLCMSTATAARLTSPNYQLDSNMGGSFGGATSSSSYKMTSIGGEAIVGEGASGSYKITQAVDDSVPYITVGIPLTDVMLGTVTSGTSRVEDFDAITETNAANYSLAILQDHDLQTGDVSATIPSVSGTTETPLAWIEGTTTGLGYSLAAAPQLHSKWSSGTKFAAIPNSATTFYDGTGAGMDTITLRLRLDVSNQQKAANYSNLVTVSGTMTP